METRFGAALMFPSTLSLLVNVFTERAERARAPLGCGGDHLGGDRHWAHRGRVAPRPCPSHPTGHALGPSLAAEVAALFPNPSVHLLPSAGHYPQHDQPDTVAELLKEPGQPDHNPRQ